MHVTLDLLYLFIVHGISSVKPAKGWGNLPSDTDIETGDNIERMRMVTEWVISKNKVKRVEITQYKEIMEEVLTICTRIDNINSYHISSDYVDLLSRIRKDFLDDQIRTKYLQDIKQMADNRSDLQTGREHFVRMSRIVLELNPSILQAILVVQLPLRVYVKNAHKLRKNHINTKREDNYKQYSYTRIWRM